MKLAIKTRSETPIYEQLYNQIVANVIAKEIKPHDCLPSIRLIARELEISVVPVKAAYELLEQNGYIYTVPGKGCFVAELQIEQKKNAVVKEKILETVLFCKEMGLDCTEIVYLVKDCWEN